MNKKFTCNSYAMFLCLLAFIGTTTLNAQEYVWAKVMGGTSIDQGKSVAVDAIGNVYTTGFFQGTTDFDPGAGTANLTSAGSYDIFVSKFDANGNYVWAKAMGGTGVDIGFGIAVDANGNVYTTGYFERTVDFDPGAGTVNLTSAGAADIFVSKLDVNGNYVWAKATGGSTNDISYGIAVDGSGNVYTTGYFQGIVDFDPGAATSNLTSAGSADIFVRKLDANGNYVWAKAIGGSTGDVGNGIVVDASGNVYTTGYFRGTADFDPGAGTANLTSAGSADIFVSKFDANGNYVWAKAMGGTGSDQGSSIATDASGNVYTTGYFQVTADFDPSAAASNFTSAGSVDLFISKLDVSGNYVWAKAMGSTSVDYGSGIAVDVSGNVYTTGSFQDIVDFDPGVGTANIASAGSEDIFVSKLDVSGNYVWTKAMGGTSGDVGNGIAIDAKSNVYSIGWFSAIVDFDPGVGTTNLTSAGSNDIFVSKLGSACSPTVSSFTVAACGSYTWAAKGNKVYTASNNTDTILLVNAGGCDSIVTLNLTINNPPNISYSGVSNTFPIGTAISSLSPSNTGGAPTAGTSNPTITTLGSGFSGPTGVAVDAAGEVYVADANNNAVKKIVGSTVTTLGSGFNGPTGVAVDAAGAVYVADASNNAVKKIVGSTVTTLGSGFNIPIGVAVDAAGAVYVADLLNGAITKIAGSTVSTIGYGFSYPSGVAVDAAGVVYVADYGNNAVKKIVGSTVTTLGSGFDGPNGVAVDAAGAVYVADFGNSAVKKIVGSTVTTLGSGFNNPNGVAVDAAGAVYVADVNNNAVKKMVFATYSISPALPTGLSMDINTGIISGTPTVATTNNTYTITTQNTCGSSTATINFATVVPCTPTSSTFTITACGNYTWAAKGNKVYTVSNNTDTVILVNAGGCDSIVTLNLTINNPTSDTTASVCNKFTWRGTTYYNTGDKTFTLTGAGAGGCDSVITLHLTITTISNTFSKTDAGCYGSSTGSITITPNAGVPPFTYRIGTVGLINASSGTFNNLKAGSYRAYVQDASGCIGVAAPIVVGQSAKVSATATGTNLTCNGSADGKITISNPVGNAPFQYKFGTAGTYAAFTAPYTATGLAAGNYGVYLQDASGCTGVAGSVSISQPNKVTAAFTKTNETCPLAKNGSITATAAEGIAPYQYKLNTTGIYGSNNQFTGLSAGTYKVYVKDANSCQGVSAVITIGRTSTTCTATMARAGLSNVKETGFSVSLSPNPTTNQFTLTAHSSNTQSVSIRVMDAVGKMVYATKVNAEQACRFGNSFANGLYMIEVRQGDEVKTLKAVKAR